MAAYDPENYRIQSRDKKGHSSSLRIDRLNIPVGVMQDLAELVASRQVPHLRTPADCLRDALGRWLEWMVNEQGIESLSHADNSYRLNIQADVLEQRRQEDRTLVGKIEHAFHDANTPNEKHLAYELALKAVEQLEDPSYKDDVQGYINLYHK